jgi:hypothetical protein
MQPPSNTLPRGYRNNNPGNIDRTAERWIGMSKDQSADARFAVFDSPEYGIRALMRLLITYQDRHGLNTVRGIINRWAPPVENDTTAYARQVAQALEVDPDDKIDTHDRATVLALAKAIIRHELGSPSRHGLPEHWYDDDTYARALTLAGFKPDPKPLATSKTVAGSVTAGAATVASVIYEVSGEAIQTAQSAVGPLSIFGGDTLKYVFAAIALAGIATAIYARVKDQDKRLT